MRLHTPRRVTMNENRIPSGNGNHGRGHESTPVCTAYRDERSCRSSLFFDIHAHNRVTLLMILLLQGRYVLELFISLWYLFS